MLRRCPIVAGRVETESPLSLASGGAEITLTQSNQPLPVGDPGDETDRTDLPLLAIYSQGETP
jgi:hypothetical protein